MAGDVEAHDVSEMARCVAPDAKVEKLASGFKFIEGPVWLTDAAGTGLLVFSDIPADRLHGWDGKAVTTFRDPSHNANGNTTDRQGRLITCEHGSRRVTITEGDGTVRTLVERYEGKRLNSPNDAAVKSDGSIWFTDPPYGLPRQTEGKELDRNHVFRLDPATGQLASVAADIDRPNGICFSPDERWLYVADSSQHRRILRFDVRPDGTLGEQRVVRTFEPSEGAPDGIRCDADGRLWSSARDGVHVMTADGTLLGKVRTPETVTNLCFGGEGGRTLFMTGTTSLYVVDVKVTGAR
jgi:gluconolactonase